MRNRLICLFLSSVLSCALVFFPGNIYRFRDHAHFVLILCWSLWAYMIAKEVKTNSVIPALILTGVSGASIFASSYTNFDSLAYVLDGSAAEATCWVFIVITIVTFGNKFIREVIHETAEIAAWLTGLLMIFKYYGISGVISIDASFIALLIPSLIFRKRRNWKDLMVTAGIPLVAVLFNGSGATGIFALCAVAAAYCIIHMKRKSLIITPVVLIVFIAIGFFTQGEMFINSSGRLPIWHLVMGWWVDNANKLFGTGLGTFQILGIGIQSKAGLINGISYMHNEYLQILFEQGIVGLGLAMGVFIYALMLSYRSRSWIFMSLCSLGIICLTQSPLRIAVISVYVALLIREALSEDISSGVLYDGFQGEYIPPKDYPQLGGNV